MSTGLLAEPEVAVSPEALTEVVDGVTVEKPMSAESTWVGSQLQQRLGPYVADNGIGTLVSEMMFVFDADGNQKRRPDVAFIAAERWPVGVRPPREGDWPMIPDLAIEVVSPNDSYRAVQDKVAEYFDFGVRQVWVVDPVLQLVIVYDSLNDSHTFAPPADLTSKLIPGWSLPLAKLFGNPPPP